MYSRVDKYVLAGLAIYAIALLYLHFVFQLPFSDFLAAFLVLGIGFSSIAWLFTRNLDIPLQKPLIKNELWWLLFLILWVTFYITYGGDLVTKLLPDTWSHNPQSASILSFLRKSFAFVLIPFAVYRSFGFTLKDFGLKHPEVKFPGRKTTILFISISAAALLFQYFLSNGSKPVRSGHYSILQLVAGLPLCFVYLLFDAGLIEEFFFRGMLQPRLTLLLKSATGGIICTACIFGLVHAPGLFLRGAESEGMEEQMPFLFWAAYTIVYMGITGIFLGIIYYKTKNLWLVMAIHAMVDLLPNFPEFARTWHL